MTDLAPEELVLLDVLRSDKQARERIPASEHSPAHNPEKFAFPIGMDESGEPFPIEGATQ